MGATYLGGGWLPGVPARDLTADEYEEYRKTIRESEKRGGQQLYKAEPKPRSTAKRSKSDKASDADTKQEEQG